MRALSVCMSPPACCVRAPAACPSQIYTADVDEYLNALAHMVRSVKHLTQGWGRQNLLPAWVRRIFRDLLAALMLAPTKFRQGMRPTRSAYTKDVWDPRDRTQKLAVTIMHKDQWWSRPPHEWARRVHDYMDPALIPGRELGQQSGATRAAHDGTGEDANGEAATAQRTHAASMRRRHDEARSAVRPPVHPRASCACGIGVTEPGVAPVECVAAPVCTAARWSPALVPRRSAESLRRMRSVARASSRPSRRRLLETGSR